MKPHFHAFVVFPASFLSNVAQELPKRVFWLPKTQAYEELLSVWLHFKSGNPIQHLTLLDSSSTSSKPMIQQMFSAQSKVDPEVDAALLE
jgi:hypothetical protein